MKRYTFAVVLASLTLAAPTNAQTMQGIFTSDGDRIAAKPAKISFPKTVAGLKLLKTGEYSHKGEALDSFAEFDSPDGKVWATLYVYRPGYPDAALAAYETDRVMTTTWGPATVASSKTTATFAGRAQSAIRITYKGASRPETGDLATASAFAQIGGWIVKLRISGPTDRESEVYASLDAFLSAADIARDGVVAKVAPLEFAAACPATPSGPVKLVKGKDNMANALGAAMMSIVMDGPPKDNAPLPAPFPANGATKVCSRGTIGNSSIAVIQPAGNDKPATLLAMLSDDGDAVIVAKNLLDKNYTLIRTKIGIAMVLGEFDRLPDNGEIARIFAGEVPGALDVRISVVQKASGNSDIQVNSAILK